MITRQQEGPIVFLGDSRAPRPSPWRKFLLLKEQDRLQHLKRVVKIQQPPNQEKQMAWSWRNLLNSILGQENKKKNVKMANPLIHSISMIDGLTLKTTMDGSLQLMSLITSLFATLKQCQLKISPYSLSTGVSSSLTASKWSYLSTNRKWINDGTTCEPSNYRVWNCFEWKRQNTDCVSKWNTSDERKSKSRDDAFWVPRYFPFCQIAERSGSLEFFGFTTSARKNRPQLLIGASSTLQTLRIPELAAAFCVSEERVKRVNRYGTARGCYIAFSNCSTTR
ncbi:hypothetical protein NC653_002807 [Populus alba x Populus x berolinensis]|uniref:Cupin type-1 domain-containing protein n=1 Tax=Populus alba x Populus x berolinensis TaxID=444605 RepID=A0AAD6RRI7_9ROSI|nr:hypothetical protein NC653_002807 [Populus alba x Populus x berolinensis]